MTVRSGNPVVVLKKSSPLNPPPPPPGMTPIINGTAVTDCQHKGLFH